jgi:hypothetical protein
LYPLLLAVFAVDVVDAVVVVTEVFAVVIAVVVAVVVAMAGEGGLV